MHKKTNDISQDTLSPEEQDRYARNMNLEGIGPEGQKRLLSSSVLVVGAGGLGSSALYYLAAAGVGTIGIVDFDVVSFSNLNRQILYKTADIDSPKLDCAAKQLSLLNPHINIQTHSIKVDKASLGPLIKAYDIVLDCVDNFPTKFAINDACVEGHKPFVHAGITQYQGQIFTRLPNTPDEPGTSAADPAPNGCLRCLFPEPPADNLMPINKVQGVLGAAAGTMGTLEAIEAIKFLTQNGELLTNRVLSFDAKQGSFRELKHKQNKTCPVCIGH